MPLSVEDLLDISQEVGVKIKWFDEPSQDVEDLHGVKSKHIVTSYAEAPGVIRINRALKATPEKLKYDLAVHIGHKVLHNSDGEKHVIASDNRNLSTLMPDQTRDVNSLDSKHILQAWRDFECSIFCRCFAVSESAISSVARPSWL